MREGRLLLGFLALICAIVVEVAVGKWLQTHDEDTVLVGLSLAGPPLAVALLGPGVRLVPLLAAASVAYTIWFWFAAPDHETIAADNPLGAFRLWPVRIAWVVAGALILVAAVSWIERALRRRARRLERRDEAK